MINNTAMNHPWNICHLGVPAFKWKWETSLHVLHRLCVSFWNRWKSNLQFSVLNLILIVSICVVLCHVCWAFDDISVGSSLINFTYQSKTYWVCEDLSELVCVTSFWFTFGKLNGTGMHKCSVMHPESCMCTMCLHLCSKQWYGIIPVADLHTKLSGTCPRPLQRDPILSFSHTFSPKSTHIGGPHPKWAHDPQRKSWIHHCIR